MVYHYFEHPVKQLQVDYGLSFLTANILNTVLNTYTPLELNVSEASEILLCINDSGASKSDVENTLGYLLNRIGNFKKQKND